MLCRACNTRIEGGARVCPNCGNNVKTSAITRARKKKGGSALSPSTAVDPVESKKEEPPVELELEESQELRPPEHAISAEAIGLDLDSAQLASLLAEQPELLGPGISVHSGDGKPSGSRFPTDVGEIDLLARDEDGGWVVVMLAEGDPGRGLISEVLERIGWVRTHLSKQEEQVRGLVVAESLSKELGYAVAALGDTLRFKTWRVSLLLEDVVPGA